MQIKEAIIQLKSVSRNYRSVQINNVQHFLFTEDHERQLKQVLEFFPYFFSPHLAKSKTLLKRYAYRCESLQSRDLFKNVNPERLHQDENRKPVATLKNRKTKFAFATKPVQFCKRMKTRATHIRVSEGEEYGEGKRRAHDPKHTRSSVIHGEHWRV